MASVVRSELLNDGDEGEYTAFLLKNYGLHGLKIIRASTVCFMVLALAAFLQGDPIDACIYFFNSCLCAATSLFLKHSDSAGNGNNAEMALFTTLCVITTAAKIGNNSDTYNMSFDDCFTMLGEGETRECVISWMRLVYVQGVSSCIVLVFLPLCGIIRLRYMKLLVALEIVRLVLRCFVLTPIPPELRGQFFALTAFASPFLMYKFASTAEKSHLRLFFFQRDLKESADELREKLDIAERALKFEAPTQAEIQVVDSSIGKAAPGLKSIEIAFEQLELRERIGTGAFGEVLKAVYAGAPVAVKRLLRGNINSQMIELLLEEVELLRNLRHPNIVQLVGVSWDTVANVCMVCEFAERGDLRRVLYDPSVALSWLDPKLRMAMDIASALVFMHSRSPPILHRDVKPDNVLVSASFTCKLTDFGVSRSQVEEISGMMTTIGTPHYMAPEVVSGNYYTGKVDIFGLGVSLLEMHTRKQVYRKSGKDPKLMRNQILNRVVKGRRPDIPSDMPAPLQELISVCWSQDPDDRPTAVEALATLHSIQEKLWTSSGGGGDGASVPRSTCSADIEALATKPSTIAEESKRKDDSTATAPPTSFLSGLLPAGGL